MPGIDYAAVRARVSLRDVLELLGFEPIERRGDYLRGLCPQDCSWDPRIFVADLSINRYYCHSCKSFGNQLDLWSRAQKRLIYPATEDLCRRLNIQVPRIYRW